MRSEREENKLLNLGVVLKVRASTRNHLQQILSASLRKLKTEGLQWNVVMRKHANKHNAEFCPDAFLDEKGLIIPMMIMPVVLNSRF